MRDANELTNVLSTYPAGWPGGTDLRARGYSRERSAFGSRRCLTNVSGPPISSRKKSRRAKSRSRTGQSPAKPERPEFPLHDAGKIRDAKMNRAIAQELGFAVRAPRLAVLTGTGLEMQSEIHRAERNGWLAEVDDRQRRTRACRISTRREANDRGL